MSRIAKSPISIPKGVEFTLSGNVVSIKGPKGQMNMDIHPTVELKQDGDVINFAPRVEDKSSWAMAGTMRAIVNNMVSGVNGGFQKKLELVGVGYRAQLKGKTLSLSLGFSHPVEYEAPEGITIEAPSQTELVISGCDKQAVGQVAADIRAFRPPEPYKGKGVKYADEVIVRKEAKKK
ncbi:MAG: 50S ribosomal protein L6 [Gammaproteobacteria bacterium]|nr:50S ribosomal protein L6 [Gammaproteobacteria bacterium]